MAEPRIKDMVQPGGNRNPGVSSMRDKILSMKCDMNKPAGSIFPLDDESTDQTYPDFAPWKDDLNSKEKLSNMNYLNKGYFESPQVPNEYYSARNIIQETIFSSSKNCPAILKELSQHLTKSYEIRNESINKIRASSSNFKIPPRVTLTAHKKEAWLRDLANPDIPLSSFASKIPHGIRNKVLVDAMCSKRVPLTRAIWFTKVSLLSELSLLRKKLKSKLSNHSGQSVVPAHLFEELEVRLLQEWTQQVTDHIFKFTKDLHSVTSQELKARYQSKLNYLLVFVQTLYIEDLIDKLFFLSLTLKGLRDVVPLKPSNIPILFALSKADPEEEEELSVGLFDNKQLPLSQILTSLTLVNIFWQDFLKEGSLLKILAESLLLNYLLIEKTPTTQTPKHLIFIPGPLKTEILTLIASYITKIFHQNSNAFIIPDYWPIVSNIFLRILEDDLNHLSDDKERNSLSRTFSLLNLRNESLMLNMKHDYITNPDYKEQPNFGGFGIDQVSASRSNDDVMKLIEQLDKHKLKQAVEPIFARAPTSKITVEQRSEKLKVIVLWCISSHRNMGLSKEWLLMVCNYIKQRLLGFSGKGSSRLKAEVENEILEAIFMMGEVSSESISFPKLYAFINELYQLKVITISAYLRKVIASGIFYHADDMDEFGHYQIRFHLSIIKNLPVLNNKQSEHFLKKWDQTSSDSYEKFNKSIQALQEGFLNAVITNSTASVTEEEFDLLTDLSVGIKFLLANWVTSTFKESISNSPRLVHLTPLVVTKFYRFYEYTDNLTVFFKAFVKFVLKNENKIIIFYLDTLYLLSKLIMQHYNLIKYSAGASADSSPTVIELFKLLVSNYKDLSSRETSYHMFNDVWSFIKNILEKQSVNVSTNQQESSNLPFDKESVETPMYTQLSALQQKDPYTVETLSNDLQSIQGITPSLSPDEKSDIVNEVLGIPSLSHISPDQVLSQKHYGEYLDIFCAQSAENSSDTESVLSRVMHQSLDEEKFQISLKDIMNGTTSAMQKMAILSKLIVNDFISFSKCLEMIDNLGGKTPQMMQDLKGLLIFSSEEAFPNLSDNQYLLLQYQREYFLTENRNVALESALTYALRCIQSNEPSVLPIMSFIRGCLIQNTMRTIQMLTSRTTSDELRQVTDEICESRLSGDSMEDLRYHAERMDEFNLPMMQLLICVATRDMSKQSFGARNLVETILGSIRVVGKGNISFFGELFNFVSSDVKMSIFQVMEDIFLQYTKFSKESASASLTILSRPDHANLMPAFKEYFKKFTGSSVSQIETSRDHFLKFVDFLRQLMIVINDHPGESEIISDTISIFLRLLIIHNSTLVNSILQLDAPEFEFLKGLVSLFNSEYISAGSEKLEIVLYDLLNLIKNSLMQKLTSSGPEDVFSATSPTPASAGDQQPTPAEEKITNESVQNDRGLSVNSSSMMLISELLDLPEPKRMKEGKALHVTEDLESGLSLDEDELRRNGDVKEFNTPALMMKPSKSESMTLDATFGTPDKPDEMWRQFCIKSFRLIEDTGRGINDGCVNLSMFEAYTTKENPA